MIILLIQPPKPPTAVGGEDFAIFEPLALEYLAAGVTEKHNVRILDMRLDRNLDSVMIDFRPDIVGITAYTVHVNIAKDLFRRIKEINPEICTVVGGHHATVMPEDFMAPNIDVIITGEGVASFQDLVECLDSSRPLKEIDGAAISENGTVMIVNDYGSTDLDALPFPRRDLTVAYRNEYYSEWMKPLASIRTSKGCHFRCRFCALWKLTGGKYLTRSPESIVEELATISEENVFFADDESLLDTDRMSKLADLIEKSDIKKNYFLYGRSDTIVNHSELITKWKGIGLKRVFVGLEFFRDEDLKYIRKGSTADNNMGALKILKDLDIDIFPMFMIRPEFDRKDFAELIKVCRSLELDFIGFSVLTPLPGTDLYNDVKDSLISTNYDHFDFFHPLTATRLPMKEFFQEFKKVFERARSLRCKLRLMGKYRLRELPSLMKLYGDFMKRLGTIYLDYEDAESAREAVANYELGITN